MNENKTMNKQRKISIINHSHKKSLLFIDLLPNDTTIVLTASYDFLAEIADFTRKDLILVSFEQSDIFSSLAVPNSSYSIESTAHNEVSLRIEPHSSDFPLMPSHCLNQRRSVNRIQPHSGVRRSCNEL